MYYNPELLQDDELSLRKAFVALNDRHELTNRLLGATFFIGYWPLAYYVSRRISPKALLVGTLGYAAVYGYLVLPFTLNQLQSSLNNAAVPFAKKYGIKKPDDYVQ